MEEGIRSRTEEEREESVPLTHSTRTLKSSLNCETRFWNSACSSVVSLPEERAVKRRIVLAMSFFVVIWALIAGTAGGVKRRGNDSIRRGSYDTALHLSSL